MSLFERLALALRDLPPMEAIAWIALINIGAFVAALAFGHLVILLCRRRFVHAAPAPLTRAEVALAAACVAVNFGVTWVGFVAWKEGEIQIRSGTGWGALLDFAILFLVMDFLMYALHRVAHHRWFYRWLHAAHHDYQDPRPLSLFVMNPLETLAFGGLWLSILLLYSPTWEGMTAYMVVNLFSGMLGHVGVDPFPRAWSRIPVLGLISTSGFHNEHHRDRERNMGFYTVAWDRLFGTMARRPE